MIFSTLDFLERQEGTDIANKERERQGRMNVAPKKRGKKKKKKKEVGHVTLQKPTRYLIEYSWIDVIT